MNKRDGEEEVELGKDTAARTDRKDEIPALDAFDRTMAISTDMIGSAPERLLEPALQIRRGEKWERYPLRGKEVTIGHIRQPDNSITLDDQQVSRRHAKILFDKPTGTFFFLDVGSTNGSFVNGIPVMPHDPIKLANNDQIKLGDTRITVYLP